MFVLHFSSVAYAAAFILLLLLGTAARASRRHPKLPPGPAGLPILGMFDLWLTCSPLCVLMQPRQPSPTAHREVLSEVSHLSLATNEDEDVRLIGRRLQEWAKDYGNIFSLKIGSGTMIVLSDANNVME